MKKITIGIAISFSLVTTASFAAPAVTSKNDTAIPCYNGGFNFGLAGYSQPSFDASEGNKMSDGTPDARYTQTIQTDYK